MDGENNGKPWKTLLKWMIWWFSPYFWKHPYRGLNPYPVIFRDYFRNHDVRIPEPEPTRIQWKVGPGFFRGSCVFFSVIIKLPILGGMKTLQTYGKIEGFSHFNSAVFGLVIQWPLFFGSGWIVVFLKMSPTIWTEVNFCLCLLNCGRVSKNSLLRNCSICFLGL